MTMTTEWHDHSFSRFQEAMTARFREMQERHFTDDAFAAGWEDWFRKEHPELFGKYAAAEARADALALSGRTDAEAQKEFNEALRIVRNGAVWALERFIGWKKDQEAMALR